MAILDDGLGTTITAGTTAASVKFTEVTLKPPGYVGGGAKAMTTLRNVKYRTQKPKKLITTNAIEGTCFFDAVQVDVIEAIMQVNQKWTIDYGDGSSEEVWGWLEEFVRPEHKEGEPPIANFKIELSNLNATSVEEGPAYVAPV